MLDKGLCLIEHATDLQHVPGLVLKRNAQFPLDVHEGARQGDHMIHPRCWAASNNRIAMGLWGSIVTEL
jgi:hypothetical protein